MDVGRQKLKKNCDFEVSRATLTHEMDVGRQKLRKNCDFYPSRATFSHEMDVKGSSQEVVLRSHASVLKSTQKRLLGMFIHHKNGF